MVGLCAFDGDRVGATGARAPDESGSDVVLDERVEVDLPHPEPSAAGRTGRWLRSEPAYWVGSVALLVAITTWLYGPHVLDSHWILSQPNFDWAQEVWFLAWPAFAIQHGHNPFYSSWINVPRGMNLMENTSMPLLGIVFAPVTWLAGPIVTYSLVLRVGMIASACSAQWVGRRLGLSRLASLLAGLFYAFSTIELVEGNGHAFLTFAPLPPLICYLAYRVVAGGMRPARAGLTAGALLGLEALISLEMALMAALACAVGVVVAAIAYPRAVTRSRTLSVLAAVGWALLAAGAVLAVPMVTYFGPGHFWGPSHANLSIYRANLESVVVPGTFTWLSPLGFHLPTRLVYRRENGAYLGVLALAALVAVAVRGWRVPLVRIGSIAVGVLLVLSLGVRLNVTPHPTRIPLPWAVLARLPFLNSMLPVRLFIMIGLGAGLLLGYGLDRAIAWTRPPDGRTDPRRAGLVAAAAVLVVGSLLPARPYPASQTGVPSWLGSAPAQALVPTGAVALFYPYPTLADNRPMLFQAADAFRYRLIGGQGIVTTTRVNRHAIGPLPPFDLPAVFLRASTGELHTPRPRTLFALPPLPPRDRATASRFLAFVSENGVTAIVVTDATSPGARLTEAYLRYAFGDPVTSPSGAVMVWPHAALLRAHAAAAASGVAGPPVGPRRPS